MFAETKHVRRTSCFGIKRNDPLCMIGYAIANGPGPGSGNYAITFDWMLRRTLSCATLCSYAEIRKALAVISDPFWLSYVSQSDDGVDASIVPHTGVFGWRGELLRKYLKGDCVT